MRLTGDRQEKRGKRISGPMSYGSIRVDYARRVDDAIVASAQATAFLWKRHDKLWLVTNAHNVTGWDYLRSQSLSPTGFAPTEAHLHLMYKEPANEEGYYHIARTKIAAPLHRDGAPNWFVHPAFGPIVDVAVISIGVIDRDKLWPASEESALSLANEPLNELRTWTNFHISAGDDAYVIGFPMGLDGGEGYPLWKRASVASEPDLDLDGLPKVLIDTTTREGMSGSPVVGIRRGLIPKAGAASGEQLIGQAAVILGVYSGRLADDPLGAQLGVVWKIATVDEIIDGQVLGASPWG